MAPPDRPSTSTTTTTTTSSNRAFIALAVVLLIGIAIAAYVMFTANPGQGNFSLGGVVVGLVIAAVIIAGVVLVLLVQLNRLKTQVEVRYPGAERAAPAQPTNGPAIRAFTNIAAAEEAMHVLTLEGIGEKYATRLNNHGIITVPQLLRSDPHDVARAVDATPELVEEWQGMGRLIEVKGIGPQSAEILALAGIRTVQELAESNVAALTAAIDAIEARRKTRVLKTDVNEGHVSKWVKAAQAHLVTAG